MAFDPRYKAQVQLLVQVLPIVAQEKEFALKGGTAINLFVRPMPRLSVDIDLAFTPILSREETLSACVAALDRIAAVIRKQLGFAAQRHAEFSGMLREDVSLQVLEQTKERLIESICQNFTEQDAQFLMSFKRKQPDWSLLPLKDVEALPAVRWKLQNLAKMPAARHAQAVDKLEGVLNRLLSRV